MGGPSVKYNLKGMLALILALSMSFSLLGVSVWAAETEGAPNEAEVLHESDDSSQAEDELPAESAFLEEEVVEESVTEEAMMANAGSGTENDPYVVTTWEELRSKMSEGGHITLGNDITAPSGGAGLASNISDTDTGGQQSFQGGYITGGYAFSGGGIRVDNGGKLTMTGGTIIGNTGVYGGGMDVEIGYSGSSVGGTAIITGGAIMYNYGTEDSGGIHTNGAYSISIPIAKSRTIPRKTGMAASTGRRAIILPFSAFPAVPWWKTTRPTA